MPKYEVTLRGTREVICTVIVSAKDDGAAEDKAALLVDQDFYGELEWEDEGDVEYQDIDQVTEIEDDAEVTKVRSRR